MIYKKKLVFLENRLYFQVAAHWIIDFPLFTEEDGKLASTHHPFTAPVNEHLSYLDSSDRSVWNSITGQFFDFFLQIFQFISRKISRLFKKINFAGQHYDLVMNGVELGGGSIRIHNSDLQRRVLDILGEPTEQLVNNSQAIFQKKNSTKCIYGIFGNLDFLRESVSLSFSNLAYYFAQS